MTKEIGKDTPRFNVRDFGAVGDGKTDDTLAVQQAIDACARTGGGVVALHNGVFLVGSLELRSHVDLNLSSTATLLGSPNASAYHLDEKTPYRLIGRSLIYARGCEQISITGQGTIDGQGARFNAGDRDERPVLVRFRDCRNVKIEGVLVKNAASFAVHPIHCRQVRIEGIRIDSRVRPNNDGIDLDGCQEVFISNCNITTIDDSIALKSLEPGAPCSDIVVTNCILSSDCAAIRLGPDAVTNIERVAVSNCVIRDTHLNGIKIEESFGAAMKDLVFSNIVMDNVKGPISLRLAGWGMGIGNVWAVFDDSKWETGELRNVLFDNIRASSPSREWGISITGARRARPRDITFSNMDITFPGGGTDKEAARREVPDLERDYPECFIFGVLPAYGLYTHHADGITLNNVRFRLQSPDLRPAIVCDDAQDLEIAGLKAEGNPQAEALIRLQQVHGATIVGSRPLNAIGCFLQVEGDRTRSLFLRSVRSDLVGEAVKLGAGAPPGAVSHKE